MSEYIYGSIGDPLANALCEICLPRAEVVRCRDCKFAEPLCNGMYDCNGELTEPWDYYNDEPQQNEVPPDGFCSWGERR